MSLFLVLLLFLIFYLLAPELLVLGGILSGVGILLLIPFIICALFEIPLWVGLLATIIFLSAGRGDKKKGGKK